MKKILLSFLVIFNATHLCAQAKKLDSLKLQLAKEKTDTGRVKLLTDIGGRFGFGRAKNDSALWYLNQALSLSKKIKYTAGEFLAEQHIAYYLYQTGSYPEALKLVLQNIKKAQKLNDKGTEFFQTRLIMWVYGAIGDYKKALHYGEKLRSLASLIDSGNHANIPYNAIADNNLATVYLHSGKFDSALHYYYSFNRNASGENDIQMQAFAKSGLADTYSGMGNYDSAFFFYRMGIPLALRTGRIDVAAGIKLSMAALFQKKGQLDSAFFYARQSLEDVQETDRPEVMMGADSVLSQLYQARHQYDSAYKYLKTFVILNDSINNTSKIIQAQNLSFNETLQQQQIELAKKEAQQEYKTQIKFYILAAVILIFLLIAFLLYRNNRNKQKANLLLSKQKEEIQNALSDLKSTQQQLIQSEKMASLGELTAGIAHEIQNPLNFVNNFSEVNNELLDEATEEINKGNIDQVKNALNDIKENSEKILHHGKRADAIVKGMLQHSRTSSGQKELTDINALCDEYLRLSFHGLRAKDKSFNAQFKTEFDNNIGKINIVPQDIGRVLLNLYNNAFYAATLFPEREIKNPLHKHEPAVWVKTKKEGDTVLISVKDNGPGIPENIIDKIFQPFFTTKPTGSGTGLGLSLSYDIVKAHGGSLKVNTVPTGKEMRNDAEKSFTEFIITLPI